MTPGQSKAKASPDDKQEFLKNVTKLLTILGKMGKQKPGGVDISKEMQAASDAVQKALEKTGGDSSTAPAADATGDADASAQAPPSPDTGSSGGAA